MLDFRRGRGHRPNHPSRRPPSAFKVALFAPILAASDSLPDAVDNSNLLPPVMDQGPTGTCEAHTEAECVFASLNSKGTPLGFVPSPATIYQIANGLQRAFYNPSTRAEDLPSLEDNGLEPVFATRAVELFGVLPMTPLAYQFSDVTPENVIAEVDPSSVTRSSTKLVRGTAAIDVLDSLRIDALCRLLFARVFVKVALFADYPAFMNYDGAAPLDAPPSRGSDHAVSLHSYRTNSSGQRIFRLRNHWSTGWGISGDFEITESFALALTDLEAVDASLVSTGGAP